MGMEMRMETEKVDRDRNAPGERLTVHLVVVDEIHVLQHAQDGLAEGIAWVARTDNAQQRPLRATPAPAQQEDAQGCNHIPSPQHPSTPGLEYMT